MPEVDAVDLLSPLAVNWEEAFLSQSDEDETTYGNPTAPIMTDRNIKRLIISCAGCPLS